MRTLSSEEVEMVGGGVEINFPTLMAGLGIMTLSVGLAAAAGVAALPVAAAWGASAIVTTMAVGGMATGATVTGSAIQTDNGGS